MGDKIKTLSQAIRLGATIRPKCEGRLFNGVGTCAFGAAYEAVFGTPPFDPYSAKEPFRKRFPMLTDHIARDIANRNDGTGTEKMTREQIADWLEAQGL